MSDEPVPPVRVSVVIPTYQRRSLVKRVVEALTEQTVQPLEVIVVVDGSDDGTAPALSEMRVSFDFHVLEQENSGAASARNAGARVAQGEVLLFLDDDMLAAPDLVEVLARTIGNGADAVLGHIPLARGVEPGFLARGVGEWADKRRARLSAPGAQLTPGDLLTGQLCVRRTVFEALGGFDERFTEGGSFGGEDTDFGRRLLTSGHTVIFSAAAVSEQFYSVSSRAYLRQWHQAGSADAVYLRKHPGDFEALVGAKRPQSRVNRFFVRPVARVPAVRDAIGIMARTVAVRLADRRGDDPRAARIFFVARNLEYWRGVERAGGLPAVRPVRVLCYHAVRDLSRTVIEEYGVPAMDLQRQLRLLRAVGFHFMSEDEVLRLLGGERAAPRRGVLLTFDDGYNDLLTEAAGVLRQARAPAVVYAVAGRLGETNAWDRALGAPALRLLDSSGLKELKRSARVTVGAHGETHTPLPRVASDSDRLHAETVGAVSTLREHGLGPIRTFAYPHGEHDEASRSGVRSAGVEAAFTVDPGVIRAGDDPLTLPRIEVLRSDGAGIRFLVKVVVRGKPRRPRWDRRVRRVAHEIKVRALGI